MRSSLLSSLLLALLSLTTACGPTTPNDDSDPEMQLDDMGSTSDMSSSDDMTAGEMGGGEMGMMMGPPSCETDTDCEMTKCKDVAPKGCICAVLPSTMMGCIPACDTDADCPLTPQGMETICSPQKVCVPKR